MHKYGREGWVNITRSGQQVREFRSVSYDYNSQKMIPAKPAFFLQAGDNIDVHCVWDTTGAPSTVTGGEDTADEMCFYLFMYYPQSTFIYFLFGCVLIYGV